MIKISLTVSLVAWLPFATLVFGILIVLLLDLIYRDQARNKVTNTTTLFLFLTSGIIIRWKSIASNLGVNEADITTTKTDMFFYGNFFKFFALVGLLSSVIVVYSASKDLGLELDLGVFYSLLMLANLGGLLVASSRNLIPLYIGYELVSIPTYAMVAFRKRSKKSAEAAMKIFLLGAFSSAIIVYGLAMYYGATGTFNMNAPALPGSQRLQILAVTMIAAGSGFKIGLVPFHFWIPDVYSGASVSVVNFLSASSKKMAFAFVFQLFFFGMQFWYSDWGILFAILATGSILIGNIAALVQDRLLRIIAYSTIAQAGYITIGIASYAVGLERQAAHPSDLTLLENSMYGILFHIIAHVLMKGAAIAVILLVMDSYEHDDHIDNFKGLLHKDPVLGGCFTLALFSLMGIPPLAGFFGKFFLFSAAVQADLTWLAMIGVIGSAVSIFYYARVIRIMVDKPEDTVEIKQYGPVRYVIILLTVLTIIMGLFADQIYQMAQHIVQDYFL